jgi:hypothetical protein
LFVDYVNRGINRLGNSFVAGHDSPFPARPILA